MQSSACCAAGTNHAVLACMQVQIKQFLERVYGLRVASVQTVNYDGKKKRRKTGFFKKPDYKKVR